MPFFGPQITAFTLLDRPFTDEYTAGVNEALAVNNQFAPGAVYQAFLMVGNRPEMLRQLIGTIALANESPNLSTRLKEDATLIQERIWHDIESEFASLSPLQQAVVRVMAGKTGQFSPFGENAKSAYKALVPGHVGVHEGTVQTAIDPAGRIKFPHLWPLKLPQAGQDDFRVSGA